MINTHLNILHLAKRQDRMDSLLKQLQAQQISFFSIWEGVDDKKNTKQAIHDGHRRIVQMARNNNFANVIIAEDDIVFSAPGAWQYFLSQIPADYDFFTGLVYQAKMDEQYRILSGMSGTHTLYSMHHRFFDFFLSQPTDSHVDRNLGQYAADFKYYQCHPMVCTQSGSYSDNKKRALNYDPYTVGKSFYGREGQTLINGIWQKKPSA